MSNLNSRRIANLNAQIASISSNNKKNLFDWKPINDNRKIFTPSTNRNDSGKSVRSNSSTARILKPLERSNSLREINNEDNIFDNFKFDDLNLNLKQGDAVKQPSSRGSSSRSNLKRFDDLLEQYQNKEMADDEEKKSLDELINQKKPQNVYELELNNYKLKEINNKLLKNFVNLKLLDFSCNKIKKIENIHNLKSLLELKLYANEIEVIENLDNSTQLLSLQLQSNRIKKLDRSLCYLKNLQVLRLDKNRLQSISQTEIVSCSNLIYLNVSDNNISSITFLNSLPNLEEFIATGMNLSTLDFDSGRCKNLVELDLSFNNLSDDNFDVLISLKYLTTLNISHNSITGLAKISKIKSVKNLNLSHNQIRKTEELTNLNELEILDLSSNLITDWFQIEVLVKCKELVEAEFIGNPIMKKKSINDILHALPNLQQIDSLPTNRDLITQAAIDLNEQRNVRINTEVEKSLALQNDFIEFDHQMSEMNEKFLKKFSEISETLNSIDSRFNGDNQQRPLSTPARAASGNHRLAQALRFSKRYSEEIEREED